MECEVTQKPSKLEKGIADGDGHAVGYMIKNVFNENYGDGAQNLVRLLASKHT